MAVAHDASTEFTATTGSLGGTHTPTGTPRGVVVQIAHNTTTDDLITGVTYGGVALERVNTTTDTNTELGRSYQYVLGTGVPTGAQTLSVSHTGTSVAKWVSCTTVTASADVEVNATHGARQNIDDPIIRFYKTLTGMGFFVAYSGLGDPSNWTLPGTVTGIHDHDFGNAIALSAYETSPSSGDQTYQFVTAAADDLAFCGLSLAEVATTGPKHLSTTLGNATNTSTTADIVIGGHTAGKRLVLAFISRGHEAATALATVSDDSGGNAWSANLTGDTDRKLYLFEKEGTAADAGATLTISDAVGSLAALFLVFDGVGAIEDVSLETNASGDETHATFDPTTDGSLVGFLIGDYSNDTNPVSSLSAATSGSMTLIGEAPSSGGLDSRITSAVDLVASGATGTITWSQTDGATKSLAFSLPPLADNAEVTPSTVAATGTVQAPTVSVGATVTPNPVTATANVQAVTVTVDATPDPVAATASVQAPTVTAGSTVTPATVAATGNVQAPTVTAGSTVAPNPVAATGVVAAPTVETLSGVEVEPDPVTGTGSVQAPTVSAGSTAAVSAVQPSATVGAPTVTGGAHVTLTAIAATASVQAPTVSGSAAVTAAVIAAAATINSADVSGSAVVTAVVLAVLATIEDPTVQTIEPVQYRTRIGVLTAATQAGVQKTGARAGSMSAGRKQGDVN